MDEKLKIDNSVSGRKTPAFSTVSIQDAVKDEAGGTQRLNSNSVRKLFQGSSRALAMKIGLLILGLVLLVLSSLILSDAFYKEGKRASSIFPYPFRKLRGDTTMYPLQTMPEFMRWLSLLGLWVGTYLTSTSTVFLVPKIAGLVIEFSETAKEEIVHFYILSDMFSRVISFVLVYIFSLRIFGHFTVEPEHIMDRSYEFLCKGLLTFFLLVHVAYYLRKLALQRIAINYHKIHYSDRVRDNNTKVGVINSLKKYVLECVPYDPQLFEGMKVTDTLAVFSTSQAHRSSSSEGRLLMDHMNEIERGAAGFAKAIIKALRPADRNKSITITKEDFYAVFQEGAAQEAFQMLDRDNNGDLTSKELRLEIIEAFQERASILKGLSENEAIVEQLDNIIGILFWIAAIYLWMNVFEYNLSSVASLVTLLATFTWVFSGIVLSVFNSIIFIFISHPYDVGDRIIFDDTEVQVSDISLLTTTFINSNGETIYFRNSELVGKKIKNIRRSGNQAETLKFTISANAASFEKMAQLKEKLLAYFAANSREFVTPSQLFFFFDVKDLKTVEASVRIEYRGNFQDAISRATRKNKFCEFFAETTKQLAIE
jgi:small-conductance mechanosensitive channel